MTTDTERLDALIARLEAATEGSREMDHGIAEAVLAAGSEVRLWGQSPDEPPVKTFRYPNGSEGSALNYTSSLDAALTLVPEGCWPWLSVYHQGSFGAHAKLYGPRIVHGVAHLTPANAAGYRNATDLWPLALCIAALKARREACR